MEHGEGFADWCDICKGQCRHPELTSEDPPGHGWSPVFTSNQELALLILCAVLAFGIMGALLYAAGLGR